MMHSVQTLVVNSCGGENLRACDYLSKNDFKKIFDDILCTDLAEYIYGFLPVNHEEIVIHPDRLFTAFHMFSIDKIIFDSVFDKKKTKIYERNIYIKSQNNIIKDEFFEIEDIVFIPTIWLDGIKNFTHYSFHRLIDRENLHRGILYIDEYSLPPRQWKTICDKNVRFHNCLLV